MILLGLQERGTHLISSLEVSRTVQPSFSPSIHACPAGVDAMFWPYFHPGLGDVVYLNSVVGVNGGRLEPSDEAINLEFGVH
jgi:hypothetical protein